LTRVPAAIVLRSSTLGLGGGAISGALRWVITASTPSTASAAELSMAVIRPRATPACTRAACAMSE
jgi:hypothetical protein